MSNVAAGNDSHFFNAQIFGSISRQNDVLVIRQNNDAICGEVFKGFEDLLGARIHGLSAGDDSGHAQACKDLGDAFAGRDSYDSDLTGVDLMQFIGWFGRFLFFHLGAQVFHGDLSPCANAGNILDRFFLATVFHMDVHTVHAIAFTDLDGGTHLGKFLVKKLQIQFFMGLEINHHFNILTFFNGIKGIFQVHSRDMLNIGCDTFKRLPFDHAQHAF
ncbi:hypothetical protein SDC9_92670 [bioreactor metagenome]|uniref:NAD-specific glutamate dehydrogenase n=1 Tax=bioreactor metagenome TaxID=1076179 RepID=A0A644ZZ18_9ZZZZ